MKTYIILVLFSFLALVVSPITRAQRQDWHVYTSAEDEFTAEVPTLRLFKTNQAKNPTRLGPGEDNSLDSYISVYEETESPDQDSKFKILVINGQAKIFDSLSRDKLLTYLSVMIIGDDDDPRPTSETIVKVNGLNGREYVWATEQKVLEYGSSFAIFKRGRIFDEGSKIYVIVFVGENADELKSPAANRFLNSFRRTKRKAE